MAAWWKASPRRSLLPTGRNCSSILAFERGSKRAASRHLTEGSMKRMRSLIVAAAALASSSAYAQITDGVIKIGVLTDMSSLYTDLAGAGSVAAAKMAIEDSGIEKRGYKVELVSADHENKPDIGSGIASKWYDAEKVDVIVDVPNSGVALAVNQITKDKNKVFLVSGAAS